jgi:hypothetical protein
MDQKASLFVIVALTFIGTAVSLSPQADAASYGRRQYYSTWTYHPTQQYHYCRYYYRPTVVTTTYHYHYVISYPSRPRYRYYYNPVRRVYWGRYEVDCHGNAVGYSMLKPEHRKSKLSDIAESDFPSATKMPPVPESKDGELMAAPPSDLPTDLPNDQLQLSPAK